MTSGKESIGFRQHCHNPQGLRLGSPRGQLNVHIGLVALKLSHKELNLQLQQSCLAMSWGQNGRQDAVASVGKATGKHTKFIFKKFASVAASSWTVLFWNVTVKCLSLNIKSLVLDVRSLALALPAHLQGPVTVTLEHQ